MSDLVPSRRDLLVGGAALLAAGTAWARMPDKPILMIGKDQLDRIVPLRIGPWTYASASGLVLPPPDQLARLLYDQQVARTYSAPQAPDVMLLMAYGSSQGGMLQIHRPEICYPASGFSLSETQVTTIGTHEGHQIAARSFIGKSDTRVEHVLYWTRIGDYLPTSWTAQRLAVVRANLEGRIPDGLLVRLSTNVGDPEQAEVLLKTFAADMLGAMPPARQRMLIGSVMDEDRKA
jgi:EpsI family protein